jgi:hypothetical protein
LWELVPDLEQSRFGDHRGADVDEKCPPIRGTEVTKWRALAGTGAKHLSAVATTAKTGFETDLT